MRVDRGASQILFGLLPGQTADLEGRIWRVTGWDDAIEMPLDQEAVRAAISNAVRPWTVTGNDDGIGGELQARAIVKTFRLDPKRGVSVEAFPRQWRCKSCNRIGRSSESVCPCHGQAKAQMQFIAYHT